MNGKGSCGKHLLCTLTHNEDPGHSGPSWQMLHWQGPFICTLEVPIYDTEELTGANLGGMTRAPRLTLAILHQAIAFRSQPPGDM